MCGDEPQNVQARCTHTRTLGFTADINTLISTIILKKNEFIKTCYFCRVVKSDAELYKHAERAILTPVHILTVLVRQKAKERKDCREYF